MTDPYAPDYHLELDGNHIPAALRASITGVTLTSALKGADRVEIGIANQYLRWTDHPLLRPGVPVRLELGYHPDPFEQRFVGEVVSVQSSFPAGGQPTITVAAQDRFERLRESVKTRWFAIPIPTISNTPLPDLAIAPLISIENGFIPIVDPVGAALSVILFGASMAVAAASSDPHAVQQLIRRQDGESDLEFLQKVAAENGWEMFVEHTGPAGGHLLRFMSPMDELEPVRTYHYGSSLVEWNPRITSVGVLASVTAYIRISSLKTVFAVTVGYDWDAASLDIAIRPAVLGELPELKPSDNRTKIGGDQESYLILGENLSAITAPRRILSELIPSLNERITGSGSVVGDPALVAGRVVQLEGLGTELGGRFRISEATHTIDGGGYRTTFRGRKEIWFGSIPAAEQGTVRLDLPFAELST